MDWFKSLAPLKSPAVRFFVHVLAGIRCDLREIYQQNEVVKKKLAAIIDNQKTIYANQQSMEKKFMAAIDDLKTDIAALIAEATSDITALVSNAAGQSQDPAIKQLDTDVKAATAALHNQFTAATGTPVPPADSGSGSQTTPPATTPPVDQSQTPATPASDPNAPPITTISPDSFKSGS
jgi:hypothetical protein